ncbi:MAG: hypothetical protein WB611_16735 [Stellaceae bacterium]
MRALALKQVLEQVQRAASEPQQRIFVENHSLRRSLAGLAAPLKLGMMSQTHFALSPQWAEHFSRMHAQAGGGPVWSCVGLVERH